LEVETVGRPRVFLVKDNLYQIWHEGRVVWCEVIIRANVAPEDGAAAGKAMGHFLVHQILVPRSNWLGLVLDLRRGPSVIGPVTLQVNERIFKAAESACRPIAVIVGAAPTLRSQYNRLCEDHAPRFSLVTSEPKVALDWLMRSRATAS
jgi:hypothetical protein